MTSDPHALFIGVAGFIGAMNLVLLREKGRAVAGCDFQDARKLYLCGGLNFQKQENGTWIISDILMYTQKRRAQSPL